MEDCLGRDMITSYSGTPYFGASLAASLLQVNILKEMHLSMVYVDRRQMYSYGSRCLRSFDSSGVILRVLRTPSFGFNDVMFGPSVNWLMAWPGDRDSCI